MNGYYQRNFYNSNKRPTVSKPKKTHHQKQAAEGYYNGYYLPHQQPQYPQGISGTLTPINSTQQRAFHDAIYEEEYGSDHEEECCQGRGMSAIFCWFLSVIILIGIAASVVLTVFFILKSKNYMTKTEELDLFEGDNGINFHLPETSTTTELNSIDFPISSASKESSVSIPGRTEGSKSKSSSSTSTRFPPMRRGPHQMFKESSEEESSRFQNLYPNGKYSSSERERITGQRGPPPQAAPPPAQEKEAEESSSSSEEENPFLTTTPKPGGPYVLFTSPPITTTTSYRRNLQTTRFPTGRTSFTTSTETLDSDRNNESDEKDDHKKKGGNGDKESGHSLKPPQIEEDEDSSTTTMSDSVTQSTKSVDDEDDDEEHKAEESQLNKMLLDEIPPHNNKGEKGKIEEDESKEGFITSTEFNLPQPSDPLARIIKNLAPRWGRNRTIETTTMTSGSYKYDFTISSREKDKIREKESEEKKSSSENSTSSTGIRKNGLNTVDSPNLSRGKQEKFEEEEGESPFLDVLVGSEDHKTLVTKQTEDGIVTSAILPPWYDNPEGNNTIQKPEKNSTHVENESVEESSEEKSDTAGSSGSSVFGGLLDFFKKNLPRNKPPPPQTQRPYPPHHDHNSKRIVLKRPGGELLAQGSNSNQVVTDNGDTDNSLESAGINTILPSNIMTTTITPESAVVTDDDIIQANQAYHYGTPDGGTNIYGYYPDEDKDNDKTVEHLMVQSESISDPNELMKKVDTEGDEPSHSIELQINSDASSEVVIDQGQEEEEDEYPYGRYGEVHHAGSEIRKQIVEPPFLPLPTRGGGIRRPVVVKEKENGDLEMKGSENRPVFSNTQRNIPHQLLRQRLPINRTKTTTTTTTTTTTSVPEVKVPYDSVSAEVTDNSAEKDPGVSDSEDFGRRPSYHPASDQIEENNKSLENYKTVPTQIHQIPSSGSYEQETAALATSGSGESSPNTKWSRPDLNSMSHESIEHHGEVESPLGSEELKVHPHSGDENDVLERKPVHKLDETLYPDSGSTENKKVYQVFPVGYASSTTERPMSESTISEPEKLDDENKSVGFVAPTPVNFHENMYTFSPPSSEAIYQSKDGWRPLMYNTGEDISGPTAPAISASILTPTQPPQAWRTRLQGLIRQPIVPSSPTFDLTTAASENPAHSHQQLTEDEYEQEESVNNGEEEFQSNEKQIEQTADQNEKLEQIQDSKIKFPEIQSQSQEVDQSLNHNQNQQQQQHFHAPIQRIPMQIPVPQQQQIHPQQIHHQQHRQQFQFPNNPNIDRSKYMMRPAPPPIVMRRPIQSMQYLPHGLPPRPQLIPQVQVPKQNQFNHNAPPPEFHRPSQSLVNRRRFKTLGARPRSNNVDWNQKDGKVDTNG